MTQPNLQLPTPAGAELARLVPIAGGYGAGENDDLRSEARLAIARISVACYGDYVAGHRFATEAENAQAFGLRDTAFRYAYGVPLPWHPSIAH